MVGSDLTRLSPATLSLLTNEETLEVHNDAYGLQPIRVDEPTAGIEIWAKPMAIAGRRAIAILNRSESATQVKVDWKKLGLNGLPKRVRDVWNRRDLASAEAGISVSGHDLAFLIVDGDDRAPAEYSAHETSVTGMEVTHGLQFAQLHYANTSGQVVVARMKSTSGLSTAIALPPTQGSETGMAGIILPKGTADLSFEGKQVAIEKLDVYGW